jgi:predicted small lipoprotein YifL
MCHFNKFARLMMGLYLVNLLSGCGQTGPLFLPEHLSNSALPIDAPA